MERSVSVIGCGWLGLPLAKELVNDGYRVVGSTTTKDKIPLLKRNGINAYLFDTTVNANTDNLSELFNSGHIIINIPPRRKANVIMAYPQQIQYIANKLDKKQKVVFISSTSVYPSTNTLVTENDAMLPEKPSGKALLIAEAMLKSKFDENLCILRAGGLIGYDRSAQSILGKGKVPKNIDAPLNLVHRNDCIEVIKLAISKNIFGDIFNLVSDVQVTRRAFYNIAEKSPIQIEPNSYKIVSNKKLKRTFDYNFIYPNPSIIDDSNKQTSS